VADLPRCDVDAAAAAALLQGRAVPVPRPVPSSGGTPPAPPSADALRVRGYGPDGFLGLLAVADGWVRPVRLVRGH
jgi:hypothetical protein